MLHYVARCFITISTGGKVPLKEMTNMMNEIIVNGALIFVTLSLTALVVGYSYGIGLLLGWWKV